MTYIGFLTSNVSNKVSVLDRTLQLEDHTMCLVFKTSIQHEYEVNALSEILNNHANILCWSLDLENWEKVLKVVCSPRNSDGIMTHIYSNCSAVMHLL